MPAIALIAIIIISWAGYTFINENSAIKSRLDKIRLLKHSLNAIWLILVFIMGYIGWYDYKEKWVKKVWLLVYALTLVVLFILGLIDIAFGQLNLDLKEATAYLRFFFQSPMPFMLLWFLSLSKNKVVIK